MSDEEVFPEDDISGGSDEGGGQRIGLLPAIFITILKWGAIILGATVFIVAVVVITVNILGRGTQNQALPEVPQQYQASQPIYEWFNFEIIRGQTTDGATYIIHVTVGHDKASKIVTTDLTDRKIKLQSELRRFFSDKSELELKDVKNETLLREEILNIINNLLTEGRIEDVEFIRKDVIPNN